jgi:hypothetical protein
MTFRNCPRCGDRAYEILASHDYCASCNYSSEFGKPLNPQIPDWALRLVKGAGKAIENALRVQEPSIPSATEPQEIQGKGVEQ